MMVIIEIEYIDEGLPWTIRKLNVFALKKVYTK